MTLWLCDLGSFTIEADSANEAATKLLFDIGTGDTVVEVVDVFLEEPDDD